MHRVEGDVVDSENVLDALGRPVGTVALEREVSSVLRLGLGVLNRNSPLNTAQCEACMEFEKITSKTTFYNDQPRKYVCFVAFL